MWKLTNQAKCDVKCNEKLREVSVIQKITSLKTFRDQQTLQTTQYSASKQCRFSFFSLALIAVEISTNLTPTTEPSSLHYKICVLFTSPYKLPTPECKNGIKIVPPSCSHTHSTGWMHKCWQSDDEGSINNATYSSKSALKSAKVSHIHWFPRTPTTPSGLTLFDFGLR